VGIIAHSCGVREPRELKRFHARVVQANGLSVPPSELYPEFAPRRLEAAGYATLISGSPWWREKRASPSKTTGEGFTAGHAMMDMRLLRVKRKFRRPAPRRSTVTAVIHTERWLT